MVGEGIVEFKCPSLPVHVEYLLKGKLPADYFQQVHGQMMVTGVEWCDFFSFYPEIKPLMVWVEPDLKFIDKLRFELVAFCQELDETVKRLQEA